MIDLSTTIGSIKFDFPVFNASGILGATEGEIKKVLESDAGAVMLKSITLKPRAGNNGVRFYMNDTYSINSMGLPNQGVHYYCDIVEKFEKYGKPVFVSVAGFTEDDYLTLVRKVEKKPFSAIEINLSCPNVEGKGIFAYDIKTSLKMLRKLRYETKKPLGVKLAAYPQREDIELMANGLLEVGIDFISTMNAFSLGAAIDIDKETMKINPNGGIGGLGGKAVKPMALAQVILFNNCLKGKIPIIGVGGISSGADIYEFFLAGASAVQVGTALLKKTPNIFKAMKSEINALLKEKKVKKLSDKIGSLKLP